MAPKSKAEKNYLRFVSQHKELFITAHEDSVIEGFEYFGSEHYKSLRPENKSVMRSMFFSGGVKHFIGLMSIFIKYMRPMMKGRKECFTDLKDYLKEIEIHHKIETGNSLVKSYPNLNVWQDLKEYSLNKWQAEVGFTKLPRQLIFKNKAVLFEYALLFIQEMDKSKIDQAPNLAAGSEVQRVYNSLGHAVNDITRWLRNEYGIKCQSNHPLGGLVNTPPLAGKAGMGGQGCSGLLITPEYGSRVRIAPIFIEQKLFEYTDSTEHRWIEEYCKTCGKCQRSCPVGAIYPDKKISIIVDETFPIRTCIDREKCFPPFSRTLGCSICIKVCPFSKGNGAYYKLKKRIMQKKEKEIE